MRMIKNIKINLTNTYRLIKFEVPKNEREEKCLLY